MFQKKVVDITKHPFYVQQLLSKIVPLMRWCGKI